MSELWGIYRPFLWNCQQFASLLAQMAINTRQSAELISTLLLMREEQVEKIWKKRHLACMAGMGASAFFPVAGPAIALGSWATAGIYMFTDALKTNAIHQSYRKLTDRYEELEQLPWPY